MIVCGDCEKPYIVLNPYRPELQTPQCKCNAKTMKIKMGVSAWSGLYKPEVKP